MAQNDVPRFDSDTYLDSPEREVLTPIGFKLLLGDVGDKAITKLVQIPDFPYLPISNSYRFHRAKVLEWLAGPGERILKELKQSSSSTRKGER